MGPRTLTLSLALLAAPLCATAQIAAGGLQIGAADAQSGTPKEGLQVVALPSIGFNSDLGFSFGGFGEFYLYGRNPSTYPNYRHKFGIDATYSTKGQILVHGEYDSAFLIPDVRVSACATWSVDPLYSFYGFNGLMSDYDRDLDLNGTNAVYSMRRNMLRVLSSFQGKISGHLAWVAGASFWHFKLSDINIGDYDAASTLYHKYVASGLILPGEAEGGNVVEFKAGLSYDSRDFYTSPRKGVSAELYLNGAPGFFGNSYLGLCAHYRQYFTPWTDFVTFAWHLAWQGRVAGQMPFYMLSNIYSLTIRQKHNEGLGGLNTLRGVIAGRLLGNGYGWCNLEARLRLLKLKYGKEEFSFGVNPFFDAGLITEGYATDRMPGYNDSLAKAVHCAAGLGFKIGLGANYIGSLEVAKAFRSQDGPYSIVITSNYIF